MDDTNETANETANDTEIHEGNGGGHVKRSEFIGGEHWHVHRPNPPVSECLQLIRLARAGDPHAIARCNQLYENIFLPNAPKRKSIRKSKTPRAPTGS
jgi:hypothetical protein